MLAPIITPLLTDKDVGYICPKVQSVVSPWDSAGSTLGHSNIFQFHSFMDAKMKLEFGIKCFLLGRYTKVVYYILFTLKQDPVGMQY